MVEGEGGRGGGRGRGGREGEGGREGRGYIRRHTPIPALHAALTVGKASALVLHLLSCGFRKCFGLSPREKSSHRVTPKLQTSDLLVNLCGGSRHSGANLSQGRIEAPACIQLW